MIEELLSGADYWLARWLFEKMLALLYFIGFLNARNQFPALLGEKGLLPAREFLPLLDPKREPSLFHWHYSDRFLRSVAWVGMALSLGFLTGLFSSVPVLAYFALWTVTWLLYLSIVNIGHTFYSFGWESMLIEAGFFASFLGPVHMEPSILPILMLRAMLFRVEVGAGLIKLRGDPCWRDLTCLYYHHETQPMPNPLTWVFHKIPKPLLRGGALFSHIVQIALPFFLFLPQPFCGIAAGLIVFHQLLLILAGNYSWLNWLTVALGVAGFSNAQLDWVLPISVPQIMSLRPIWFELSLWAVTLIVAWMTYKPVKNMCSRRQIMNRSYNRFHLVNTYGAFGSVTKKRYEVVLEGALEDGPGAEWREIEFKGKPGRLSALPRQYAPYHLRLDWLMWFLPFSVTVGPGQIYSSGYDLWFVRLVAKLLRGDKSTIKLLRDFPFPDKPPTFIRARYFLYELTSWREWRETGNWWKRTYIDDYLPPVSLERLAGYD